jgi:HEAT repeat protein
LGILGDTQAIPVLIQALRDEDIDVSIDAAEALGRIGNPSAIPALLESLRHDPNGEVKTAVVEALGRIGGEDVIAPLLEIAKSCPEDMAWDDTEDWNDWWDMQLKAVEALGGLRVNKAVPVLATILEDEEGQDIESEVLKALALIGGEGELVLIKRLSEGVPRVRRRAASALGLSQSTEARKALARAMTDKAGEVRVAAIRALGKLGASQYLDVMLRFIKDPDPEMRRAVIEVTRDFSVTEVDKLAALLTDSSAVVRAAALRALRDIEHFPEEILEQIRSCLNDSDDTVVAAACTLLSRLGDHSVLVKLLQILSDRERDASLRSTVATALGTLGDSEALGILSWAVGDEAQPVRLAALNALMLLEKHQAFPDQAKELEQNNLLIDCHPDNRRDLKVSKDPSYCRDDKQGNSCRDDKQGNSCRDDKQGNSCRDDKQGNYFVPSPKDAASQRTPLDVVIAALKGELLASSEVEPSAKTSVDDESAKEPDDDSEIATVRPAMSTLEAIAMDNAEVSYEQADVAELPKNSDDKEIQEYMDIAHENIELGERLFVQKKVDVAADVRYLSARILGESDLAVGALIEALNDDDPVLRREAAESLGHIASRSPETKELADAFGSLATHLNIGDRDLRLACARSLGLLGNSSAIPVLFAGLQDEDSSVRSQMIQSLTVLMRQPFDDAIIAKFVELLHDTDIGVCKAAAEALAALGHTEALDSIIEAAFVGAGARDMGRALRLLDIEQSGDKLLKMLDSVPDSSHRRFVIEMLEEVFRPAGRPIPRRSL